ncbi:cytoskeletal protein CcmA (bactofilin family) [Hydrogenispora ethanolica]|jgi:cytoskeletal protein CcmA (bactofilin family)|uniref:Cytoskeletal protein CcmA (Bactofilin family) n=1 Tax=Hydrogenispora ethanolica TaxID=1082276 RepID=A0A4R1S342_HYDET|nr:polymer-forming cytoskeletal protein [Hydrogenispora ethanolica]TCL73344.1 cytoskeletal protein CcmA (bactofilin family) [Hydrogenispora ethanolica]
MFSSKERPSGGGRIETIIAKECRVKGNLETASGSVRIDGYFEGDLHIGGDLIIGESGSIVGNIIAKNVAVAGEVKGTIEARGKLELAATARIIGDTKMAVFVVADGAFFQGQCASLPSGDLKDRGRLLLTDNSEETTVSIAKLKAP